MRRLLITAAAIFYSTVNFAQNTYQLSLVFSSEPQNAMAANIPRLLLEAYRNGDIAAYYPKNPNVRIPYTQFLQRYGESAKAQQTLTANPSWFCEESENPRLDKSASSCLFQKFELGEKFAVNQVSRENEWKTDFIRLLHSETCDPRGFETYGPLFKIKDIEKLTQKQYRITNPQNQAVKYSIIELMQLRLYNAAKRKG